MADAGRPLDGHADPRGPGTRAIPNVEYYAPWFREPMIPGISHADWLGLSDHARRLTRFVVADSGDELDARPTLIPPR